MPKSSLIADLKALTPVRAIRNRTFIDSLSSSQKKKYLSVLKVLAPLSVWDRPSKTEIIAILKKHIGTAPNGKLLAEHLKEYPNV